MLCDVSWSPKSIFLNGCGWMDSALVRTPTTRAPDEGTQAPPNLSLATVVILAAPTIACAPNGSLVQ
jgi:hypothetical protein